MLRGKNILLISPEKWEHIFVSKHHYAVHLAKNGNQVFFLNPPSKRTPSCLKETDYKGVKVIEYKGFVKGLRYLPPIFQRHLIRSKFLDLETLCNVRFDVVWSFDNSVFFDFSALPDSVLKISHIVDINQDFNTKIAAKSSDLCIGVIPLIVHKLKRYNNKTILIQHGVNLSAVSCVSKELPGSNNIKAIYTGNLDMPHINWELLERLINENPYVDFIFLGSKTDKNVGFKRVEFNANVIYMPSVSSKKVVSYLRSADVAILAYGEDYYTNYASPHKMLEYVLGGKMIVSSWTEEYKSLHDRRLISMNKSDSEFLDSFKEIIKNIDFFNGKDFQKERIKYAESRSYDKQIELIEAYLFELGYQ